MFTKQTPCGIEVRFSDCDYEKLQNANIYYERDSRTLTYGLTGEKLRTRRLIPYLFNTKKSHAFGYIYADGDIFNLQRDNVMQVPRAVAFRYRPPVCGKKYKGVSVRKNKWCASVWIERLRMLWFYERSEIAAASLYNAVCDYLKIEGYRNNVPKIELTNDIQKYIDTMMIKWGMK